MNHVIKTSFALLILATAHASMADNACMPIAQACMKAGYYKGGHDQGKGLILDCVEPVVAKSMTLSGASFTDETLQQCDAEIKQKMSEKMQGQ